MELVIWPVFGKYYQNLVAWPVFGKIYQKKKKKNQGCRDSSER